MPSLPSPTTSNLNKHMMKNIFLLGSILLCFLVNAQNLHTNDIVFLNDESIDGVAYFSNSKLLNFTYEVSIISEENEPIKRELFFADKPNASFSIDVPETANSGYYTLQVANYHNAVVTHTKNILILNEENWKSLKTSNSVARALPSQAKSSLGITFKRDGLKGQINIQPSDLVKSTIENASLSVRDLTQSPLSLDQNIKTLSEAPCDLSSKHLISDRGLKTWLTGYQIEGFAYDKEGNILKDYPVIFSYTDDRLRFNYTKTNEEGKFGFYNLDYEGTLNGYLQTLDSDTTIQTRLEIQLPLDNQNNTYTSCEPKFYLDSASLAELVRIRFLNQKVQSSYTTQERKPVWEPEEPKPLLSYTDNLVAVDDYVAMSSTKEMN